GLVECVLLSVASYNCPRGLSLYVAFTKRIPLEPVRSVDCNKDEFEVTTLEGVKIKGFTDESWLICKKRPGPPKREPNVVRLPHPVWRALYGAVIGVGIYLALLVVFLILRIPYVKLRDFWEETEVDPEYSPSAMERKKRHQQPRPTARRSPRPLGEEEEESRRRYSRRINRLLVCSPTARRTSQCSLLLCPPRPIQCPCCAIASRRRSRTPQPMRRRRRTPRSRRASSPPRASWRF
ncbi:hypothetical protein PENTCL1PPCAC_1547, partial [Pristionchus entomophagus]